MKQKRKLEIVLYIICGLILVWFGASYADVILHNGNENPVYAVWNVFTWL